MNIFDEDSTSWVSMPKSQRTNFICYVLELMEVVDVVERRKASRCLLYICQGNNFFFYLLSLKSLILVEIQLFLVYLGVFKEHEHYHDYMKVVRLIRLSQSYFGTNFFRRYILNFSVFYSKEVSYVTKIN